MLEAMIKNGIETGLGDEWIRFGATSSTLTTDRSPSAPWRCAMPYPGSNPPYRGNITEHPGPTERVDRAGASGRHPGRTVMPTAMWRSTGSDARGRPQNVYSRARTHGRRSPTAPDQCRSVCADQSRRRRASPFSTYGYYNADKFHFYGAELMCRAMAYRPSDAGVTVVRRVRLQPRTIGAIDGHSRHGDAQRMERRSLGRKSAISVEEAIRVYTLNGALLLLRGTPQRLDHAGQPRGLRHAGIRSAHGRPEHDQGH